VPKLRAPLAGYLGVKDPPGGWGEYFRDPATTPLTDYEFVSAARRFETGGTANYPGAVGLAASLKLIDQLGPDAIAEHIFGLTDRLIAGLDELGVEVVTPRERKNRSGIVTFSVGNAAQNIGLTECLQGKKILVSVRYTSGVGGVRVSCHYFNSQEDIDRFLAEVKACRK
jgi:selenocysteine lyase/cysteine desulfurase